jgi:hypothetical protein
VRRACGTPFPCLPRGRNRCIRSRSLQPGDSEGFILNYETDIKTGKFLLITQGIEEVVEKAKKIIQTSGTSELTMYKDETLRDPVSVK